MVSFMNSHFELTRSFLIVLALFFDFTAVISPAESLAIGAGTLPPALPDLDDDLTTVAGREARLAKLVLAISREEVKEPRGRGRYKQKYSERWLEDAVFLVKHGVSPHVIEKRTGIPSSTIRSRIKAEGRPKKKRGPKPYWQDLSGEEARQLAQFIRCRYEVGDSLTMSDLQSIAYDFLKGLGIKMKSRKKEKVSDTWVNKFLKEHVCCQHTAF